MILQTPAVSTKYGFRLNAGLPTIPGSDHMRACSAQSISASLLLLLQDLSLEISRFAFEYQVEALLMRCMGIVADVVAQAGMHPVSILSRAIVHRTCRAMTQASLSICSARTAGKGLQQAFA